MQILSRFRMLNLPNAPTFPDPGEMYYDTTTSKLYWWNGSTWVDSTGGSGAGGGAPSGPASGDLSGSYPGPRVARLDYSPEINSTGPGSGGPMLQGGDWGTPDGEISSRKGSLWLDTITGAPYVNTDGSRRWRAPVPAGGTGGQVLAKSSNSDFDTRWDDPPAGGGGGATEVNISTAGPSPRVGELLWVDTDATDIPTPPQTVTVLPSSPVDGQECYYRFAQTVAPADNQVFIWRLRWDAIAAAWMAIGCQPLHVCVEAAQGAAWGANAWGLWGAGVFPQLTLPRPGRYLIEFGVAQMFNSTTGNWYVGLGRSDTGLYPSSAGTQPTDGLYCAVPGVGSYGSGNAARRVTVATAGVFFTWAAYVTTAGNLTAGGRFIKATPLQIT